MSWKQVLDQRSLPAEDYSSSRSPWSGHSGSSNGCGAPARLTSRGAITLRRQSASKGGGRFWFEFQTAAPRHCLRQTRSVCARERSDEAVHLSVMLRYGLLRFARNDVDGTRPQSRGAMRPSFARNFPALQSEGAGNAGCALHPRSRVRIVL